MVRVAAIGKANFQSFQILEKEGYNERGIASGRIARSTGLLSTSSLPSAT